MNHVSRVHASFLAAGLLTLLFTGCGTTTQDDVPGGGPSPDLGGEPVGELIASWSEESADEAWVTEIVAQPALLVSAFDRDRWIDAAPAPAAVFEPLSEIDMTEYALVVGRYARCSENSVVYAEPTEGAASILRFAVESDEDLLCEWSPETLDVWKVPREQTGGQVPLALSSAPPTEASDPTQVGSLLHSRGEMDAAADDLLDVLAQHGGLLSDEEERDALADALENALEEDDLVPDALRDVDMAANHLLATGYHKCTETSRVMADAGRAPTLLWVEILFEEDVLCAWSPFTVDLWVIAHSEVSAQAELGQYRAY